MVDALGCGEVIGIVRKGGIREQRAGFRVRSDQFLLYPTRFHASVDQLDRRLVARLAPAHAAMAPDGSVRIEYVAYPTLHLTVSDLGQLKLVRHELGLSQSALEARFNYRRPGVEFIALRVARLPAPVVVPEMRRYAGCVSWVELDDAIACDEAVPVVSELDFQQRIEALGALVG
jgi:hypothetical protein